MRYMLIQNYGGVVSDSPPMSEWSPGEIMAHVQFQQSLNLELIELGEFVDGQGVAPPDQAKFVVSDGTASPVVTNGPRAGSGDLLAGYRLVEVGNLDRALAIAARISAAPGAGGRPIGQAIEVREVLPAPELVEG